MDWEDEKISKSVQRKAILQCYNQNSLPFGEKFGRVKKCWFYM